MSLYKRGNTWWVRFQFRGEEIRRSTHTVVKREAQEYEERLRAQYARIARGDKPRITFENAIEKFTDDYFAARKLKPSTQKRYLTSMIALANHFSGRYVDEINRASVIEFVNARLKINDTAFHDLACLSSIMSYMVDCEVIENNPVIGVKRKIIKRPEQRVRYLCKKEYSKLLAASTSYLQNLIIFAVETGMRQEEQLSLEWKQIDLEKQEAHLTRTKTDAPRIVPLSDVALAQIPAQPNLAKSTYVFCDAKGQRYGFNTEGQSSFKKAWEGARRRAKVEDLKWHDLRHTFASWAIKGWHGWQSEAMTIDRLRVWLGHKSLSMTMRYAHLDSDDLHLNVNRTNSGTRTGEQNEE